MTQGAEERDNKAQQILRETRQVVEQVSSEQLAGGKHLLLWAGDSPADLTAGEKLSDEQARRWSGSCQILSGTCILQLALHLLICQQVKSCHMSR